MVEVRTKTAVVQVTAEVVEQPDGVTTTLPAGIFSGRPRENTDFVSKISVTYEVLDIGDIDQMIPDLVARGIATESGDVITLDAAQIGVEKVLGGGKVTRKLAVTAENFSASAVAKIEAMGGTAQTSE